MLASRIVQMRSEGLSLVQIGGLLRNEGCLLEDACEAFASAGYRALISRQHPPFKYIDLIIADYRNPHTLDECTEHEDGIKPLIDFGNNSVAIIDWREGNQS